MTNKQEFFRGLAHALANQLAVYELRASIDPDFDALEPERLESWRDLLADLRRQAAEAMPVD